MANIIYATEVSSTTELEKRIRAAGYQINQNQLKINILRKGPKCTLKKMKVLNIYSRKLVWIIIFV